jgi:hypothetical protein
MASIDTPRKRGSLPAILLSACHVFLMAWTFFGALVLPRLLLPFWIGLIGLTFIGWIVFKGKCWLTKVEVNAQREPGQRYQSSTLRTIAGMGVDVAKHKDGLTLFIDSWHYFCVLVAFYRLGHVEYGAVFLLVWFVLNRGYRNVWNY